MSSTDMLAGPSTRSKPRQHKSNQRTAAGHGATHEADDRLVVAGVTLPRTRTIVLVLVAVAGVLRLWELGARPMHHDESLDAWWSFRFRNGEYGGYDPVYHGPLRFYITAGFYELFGESETTARLFSALSGTAVVGLPWFLRRELGRVGTIAAAVALAISPTMLYYSRFAREDAQMVFLTLLAMVLGLSYLRTPRTSTASGLAFVLACSFAIKESTYLFAMLLTIFLLVILAAQYDAMARHIRTTGMAPQTDLDDAELTLNPGFVAAALALVSIGLTVTVVVGHLSDELFLLIGLYMAGVIGFVVLTALPVLRAGRVVPLPPLLYKFGRIGFLGWAIAIAVFVAAWWLFFTVWGREPGDWKSGFTEAVRYWDSQQEVNRGGQPWYYYLYALPIYEWLFVALAAVGTWRGLRRPTMLSILMIWFAVGSLILYSYAGERMPWLIAHPLLPLLILAGLGAQHLWENRNMSLMPALASLVAVALLFTGITSIRTSFPNGTDSREILSQAGQATAHFGAVLDRLETLDEISLRETGQPATLAISSTPNAWPYSWYFRARPGVRWFEPCTGPPTDGSVDVIIIDRVVTCDTADPRVRDVIPEAEFPDYQAKLFAMRSWWVPTYTDAGPLDWIRYAYDRTLWEQGPNLGYAGVHSAVEVGDRSLRESLDGIGDGINESAHKWIGFVAADGHIVPDPNLPTNTEPDDGLDGCGSVDQWFLVHNRFAFSEANVNPGPIEAIGLLPCVSDALSETN